MPASPASARRAHLYPARMFMSVDFPAPEGPMMATSSPLLNFPEIPFRRVLYPAKSRSREPSGDHRACWFHPRCWAGKQDLWPRHLGRGATLRHQVPSSGPENGPRDSSSPRSPPQLHFPATRQQVTLCSACTKPLHAAGLGRTCGMRKQVSGGPSDSSRLPQLAGTGPGPGPRRRPRLRCPTRGVCASIH